MVGTLAEVVVLQVRIRWEVDGAEWNVTQQAGTRAAVQTHEAEAADDMYRARFDLAGIRRFTLDLQADLDNLERVGEYDLGATGHTTSEDLSAE